MKKRLKKLLVIGMAAVMCFSVAGCGKGHSDNPHHHSGGPNPGREVTLNVYAIDAGYGVDWIQPMIDAFCEQDWVQEKYPGITGSFYPSDDQTSDVSILMTPEINDYDLFFGVCNMDDEVDYIEELTDTVYKQKVPGEDITFEEKCDPVYIDMLKYTDPDGLMSDHNRYYISPWAGGMLGLLYNEDILVKQLGMKVPRTTEELREECAAILALRGNKQGKYDKGYSIVTHETMAYLTYLFPIWWAQYEGVEAYNDFYSGKVNGEYSKDIFRQKGRLYSLKTYEKLFFYNYNENTKVDNAYLYHERHDFQTEQQGFLQGYGVFMPNGDWFEYEMADFKKESIEEGDPMYTVKMMRTPIISELGEKLGITEEELRQTVDYVDRPDGKLQKPEFEKVAEGYTQDSVIEAVRKARGIVDTLGTGHVTYVPSYAKNKDAAQDFIRFMATDIAQKIYIEKTEGGKLPFTYDAREDQELYANLPPLQQDRLEYFYTMEITTLRRPASFPLVNLSGLDAFTTSDYCKAFSQKGSNLTAQGIYEKTIRDWTEEKFRRALEDAFLI